MTGTLVTTVRVTDARSLAEDLLDRDRLRHSRRVATTAAELVATIGFDHGEVLVAAAWLHDIGYSDRAVATGFHPLDGARLLEQLGWPARICALVANHSGARIVAEQRGLLDQLQHYPDERSALSEALTYADQTTGPTGQRLPIELRMAEMLRRHGPASVNSAVHHRRGPYLMEIAGRVQTRMLATAPPW